MIVNEGAMPRLAVTSWDHAWLTERRGDRRDRADIARALDGVCERGFNAVCLDPCPHLVAPPVSGVPLDRFELLPCGDARGRGLSRSTLVRPRRALLEVLAAVHERGLKVWFTSDFLPDTQARRSFVRRPRDFVRVWSETLDFIDREGLAETVCAVDIGREFPAPPAGWGAYRRIFHRHPRNPLPMTAAWPAEVARRAERYLLEIPRALRAGFPRYLFGVSSAVPVARHLRQMDTSELDFLDFHLWLNDDRQFQLASGELIGRMPGPLAGRLQGRVAGLAWSARRRWWYQRMNERLEEFLEFCRVRRVQPALSDGFVASSPGGGERGLARELGDWVVTRALEEGVQVVTPGHQAGPAGGVLWQDGQWTERQTHRILTGPGR